MSQVADHGTTPTAQQMANTAATTHGATFTPYYLANYSPAATNHYQTTNTLERLTGGTGVPRKQYNDTQEWTYGEIDYTMGMQTLPTIMPPMSEPTCRPPPNWNHAANS